MIGSFSFLPVLQVKRRADERTRTADLLITSDHSGVAGVCTGLQIPHIWAVFSSVACTVLHRIGLWVVSEWYQQRHSCLTIVLGCGIHPKDIQHLASETRIRPLIGHYSRWIPSVGSATA